ncbi:biotin carboxylase [Rubrivivax gelatinosus]|nr:biotin carboxylase [Rubrivivax gelatinosus]
MTIAIQTPPRAAHLPWVHAQPVVAFLGGPATGRPPGHDHQSKARVAAGLAELLGYDYVGDYAALGPTHRPVYLVPRDTLTQAEALRLGVRGPADLFGGVVPQPFVATKLITHPASGDAPPPAGWSAAFCHAVRDAVLPGCSCFSAADLRRAATRLLHRGAVRLKDPGGVGGLGQWVVHDGAELERVLAELDPRAIERHGLVAEANLRDVSTMSVGQVRVGEWLASYYGSQRLTRNRDGQEVYGGSDLVVVRGGFDALLQHELPSAVRLGIEQALSYHHAAIEFFPGLHASRANYDVAQGLDESGRWRSGVLEQSWRIGGASGAELVALQALRDDPRRDLVHASTHEVHGGAEIPAGALPLYDGVDAQVGRLTKYAFAQTHVDN